MKGIPASRSCKTALRVAREAALSAGDTLSARVRDVRTVSYKRRGNIVTDVDTEVEDQVRAILEAEYPEMGFLGEESKGASPAEGYVWIVDPLDGTRNYDSLVKSLCRSN